MFIEEYRKDKRIKIKASCDQCGETKEYDKSNYTQATKLHNGSIFCRSCASTKKHLGKTPYKGTPIHNSYSGAKQRCEYDKHVGYHRYGGRGIKFEWDSFSDFERDMKESWFKGGTLERIDLDGNYCLSNCTWVTPTEQMRNTSRNIHDMTQANLIRSLYNDGMSQVDIAKMFNDSQGNISNIIKGRTWNVLCERVYGEEL